MSIELVIPSNHLILCHLLHLLHSVFPSIRVFSSESSLCIRWPKYWSFTSSISPSNEYSELISFRMDWFYFLAIQGTLKSLCQHYSSKVSILRHSAIFQFSSVAQSCLTLWDPMDCSTPAQLLELTQTHVHWVSDAIQPSHPLSSPSSPAFNLSQHQGLFKWVSSLHQVAKVLEFQLQHQRFQWTLRTDQLFLWFVFHIHTRLLEKPQLWLYGPKWCLCFFICCLGLS